MHEPFDVVIIGAGFAGLYMLHRLRQQQLSIKVIEAGDEVAAPGVRAAFRESEAT